MIEPARFKTIADECCELISQHRPRSLDDFFDTLSVSLHELAMQALRLPVADGDGLGGPVGKEMTHEEWLALFQSLGKYLGEREGRWMVFDPSDHEDHEPVFASLADDLADIYRDLQCGLMYWAEQRRDEAVFQWRMHYWHHWGAHLVDAIRCIHYWQAKVERDV